jgi:hypothetical protein
MRTGVPVALIHRRNAHLSAAAVALIGLVSNAALRLGDRAGAG